MLKSLYFKDIKVSCCDLESSVSETISGLKTQKPNYICVTDVGNLVNAYRKSPELKFAINSSLMSLPDGKPLSVFAKLKGISEIERVAGPDFMQEIFLKTSGTEISHFLLGDTIEIQNLLKENISKNYNLKLAGSFSPQFENWDSRTDENIISRINSSGADIIWVSLGGGKQEIWMKNNYMKLNKGIMIGVGAAFRFYLGNIKRAPVFFQKLGLEWLFRLIQQPKKMFKRYATTLPYFLLYTLQEIFTTNSKTKNKLKTN